MKSFKETYNNNLAQSMVVHKMAACSFNNPVKLVVGLI